jgi:hypothetical protein
VFDRLQSTRSLQFGFAAVTSIALSEFIARRVQNRFVKLFVFVSTSFLPAASYYFNDPKRTFIFHPKSSLGRESRLVLRSMVPNHPIVTKFNAIYPEVCTFEQHLFV